MAHKVSMTVNGQQREGEVEPRTLLVHHIRENLGLTGTHVGCDTSQCGACVVHVDGESVKSCTLLAVQAEGSNVTTIEGLAAADGTLHPMQEAFREYHALQCGFCTPGMVMSAIDLVNSNPGGLTGTHVGCDTSQCGACVVHVDGKSVKSCTMLALQADGCSVTTIEGLAAADGTLHPMQAAFREHHGLQCGFCTPGMVMTAIDLANSHETLDEQSVREGLEGNLCRCTGYHNIVKAIAAGAKAMRT